VAFDRRTRSEIVALIFHSDPSNMTMLHRGAFAWWQALMPAGGSVRMDPRQALVRTRLVPVGLQRAVRGFKSTTAGLSGSRGALNVDVCGRAI